MGRRSGTALALLAAMLGLAGCADRAGAPAADLPLPKPCGEVSSLIAGTALYPPVETALPAKGTCAADADFKTGVTRITDKTRDVYTGPGIENEYARNDPENADGSRAILRGNDGAWYLYRTDGTLEKPLDIAGGGEEPEPRWEAGVAERFLYLHGTRLMAYDVATDARTTVRDFSGTFPGAAVITTKTEGDASLDGRHWCFMVEDSAYRVLAVIAYDRGRDTIAGSKEPPFRDGINWVSMDMGGTRCVVGYEDSDGDGDDKTPPAEAFTTDFSSSASLPEGANGHMDLALTADGTGVMVYQNNATDWIAMADLTTGREIRLLEIPFGVNPDIGLHISGNAAAKPGWALISTYGSQSPPPGATHSWMDSQLFLLELTAAPRVLRVAHTHAYTSKAYGGGKNYFAEAFASINRAGTRVWFGSNWGVFATDYSETYVAGLPASWP